ncbi:MAG TPA: hypothetical protein VEX68_23415, partial [Bryobacteraceae bacterium]|nr:hypothetical protein [Bryobacteraceae bacterium]
RCSLPGARTFDGILTVADFNLSSARARQERAKLIAERSQSNGEVDWAGLLEEFCQRVLAADRNGRPAMDLRDMPLPDANDTLTVDGLSFNRRHPIIAFGDGGSAKSYVGLYVAGRLVQQGLRVGLFDWELAGEDHRDRLERLFGPSMPKIMYARCERPLSAEMDRLRRIVRDEALDYAVFDSIAFACDGPPEAAEVAGRYFRAVRAIGIGSLHIAHVSKAEDSDKKPFGSTFWHNGARATWFVKKTEGESRSEISLGLFCRKANLGPIQPPVGFRVTFSDQKTTFARANVGDTPELAAKLTIKQRMTYALQKGSLLPKVLAEEINADVETVKRTARRYSLTFAALEDGRLALLTGRES